MRHISDAVKRVCSVAVLALVLGPTFTSAQEQDKGQSGIHIPDSSIESPFDVGARAHTNHVIHVNPKGGLGPAGGMRPEQIRSFYGITDTGGGIIGVVSAFDYPTVVSDFNTFSTYFGLKNEPGDGSVLQVIHDGKSRSNPGWNQETALDTQWTHAMAPDAKILLVLARTNSFGDLMHAVDVAVMKGAQQISMSWGAGEFPGEDSYDSHFNLNSNGNGPPAPLFFAASGDSGGTTIYPSASPFVVAVGGTSVTCNGTTLVSESAWSSGGGGSTLYIRPSFQDGVQSITGANRGVPDISSDGDPQTGVSVYAPIYPGKGFKWQCFGGTSVSSPCMAGMVNVGMKGRTPYGNTKLFLAKIYGNPGNFRDIDSGSNGHPAVAGWDFATGLGVPIGTSGF